MPKREKLTKRMLEKVQVDLTNKGGKAVICWDGEVAGFGARVSPARITYFHNYRAPDHSYRRITLGIDTELTVEAARKKAATYRVEVRAGNDPLKELRQKAVKGLTVEDLYKLWTAANRKTWADPTNRTHEQMFRLHVKPQIGAMGLTEVTKAHTTALLSNVREKASGSVAATYATLSAMFNFAEDADMIESVPLMKKKRIAPDNAARSRMFSNDLIRALWRASDRLTPRSKALFRWTILSVCRIEAVQMLRYDWITPKGDSIMIPVEDGTKVKKAYAVAISDFARAELEAVLADRAGPYVFSDSDKATDRQRSIVRRLKQLTETDGWGWHDLRRNFRTHVMANGVTRHVAQLAMGQKGDNSKVDSAYDLHDYRAEIRAAQLLWQEHVSSIVR